RRAGARPGIAADEHRAAFLRGVQRQEPDVGPALVGLEARARVGDMPAEVPDRGLRRCRRRRGDPGEEDEDGVARRERGQAAAAAALNGPLGPLDAFSVLLTPLEPLLALSRAELALVFAVASAAFGGGMNLAPHVYGLASPPTLVVACGAVSALGIALAATAGGLAQLVIGYGVLFGAGGGAGYILMQQAVNLAVTRHRGLMNGYLVA